MRIAAVTVLMLAAFTAIGAVYIQNEWTSPGSAVPVREFNGSFQSAAGINWLTEPGSLVLDYSPLIHGIDALPGGVSDILCEDMNGDGSTDIVVCEFRKSIVVYENTGNGSGFMIRPVFQPDGFGPERLACGDLDGDGDPDIAGTSRGNGSLGWLENTGSSPWVYHLLDTGEGTPFPLDIGDLNGDGRMDILAGIENPGRLVWLENTEEEWEVHQIDGDLNQPYWVSVLPAEGMVMATSFADSAVYIYTLSGNSWSREVFAESGGPLCAVHSDIDGDGSWDILAVSSLDDRVYWQNRDAPESAFSISREMIAPARVSAADLDLDGDMDVIACSEAAGEMVWWENNGSADEFFPHYTGSITGCSCTAAGDIDGDGVPDAVAASLLDGSVNWLTLGDYCSQGTLYSSVLYIGSMHDDLSIDWSGSAPEGTAVKLQVRLSADRTRMGNWIDVEANQGDLSEYLEQETRFLQYRIQLTTDSRQVTPVVEEVNIEVYPPFMI